VAIARVKVGFDAERADLIKVVAVYVRVHAEQSSHDGAHGVFERPRERHTDRIREDGLVIEDILGPVHEGVDILGRGKLRGALVTHAVFPKVLISRARGHDRALLRSAKFRHCAVQHVEVVEEIDGVDSEPFVEIFAFWELNRKSEVPGSQRRFGIFPELILLGTLGYISAWLEGACLT